MQNDEVQMTVLKINHHSATHVAERWPYAAYGSNLMHHQIAERCPRVSLVAPGKLFRHRLDFARVATITSDENSEVPVGIYRLDAQDVASLDRREGLGRAYDRYLVTPITDDGRAVRCFTYIKRDNLLQPPSEEYYSRLARGYHDWMFDDRRLRRARSRAQRAWENPKHRAEVERYARTKHAVWGVVGAMRPRVTSEVKSPVMRTIQRLAAPPDRSMKYEEERINTPELSVPRYASASTREVEWGQRDHLLYWRAKGSRAWYRDVSTQHDLNIGMVRGEFEKTLPGARAFKVIDGNTKGVRHD